MKYIFFIVFLSLPVLARADWPDADMHPVMAPGFIPNQGQPVHHEGHVKEPAARIGPQHHTEAQPQKKFVRTQVFVNQLPVNARHDQAVRHDQPVNHNQARERHVPGYFHRDTDYYGYHDVIFPYADVQAPFVVPDGFESVVVDGQIYFYNDGVFYQQMGNQLVAIPPVLGAVVDSIPEDYQIIMADGVHYLFTDGVYYQRVDMGFEVVTPPLAQGT